MPDTALNPILGKVFGIWASPITARKHVPNVILIIPKSRPKYSVGKFDLI